MKPFTFASKILLIAGMVYLPFHPAAMGQVERVWLTTKSPNGDHITVNWETKVPGNSVVRFGTNAACDHTVSVAGSVTRHQVEIPMLAKESVCHYVVETGDQRSQEACFQTWPTGELRVAVVADWGYSPNAHFTALRADRPHLLLTAGDNVPSLHKAGGLGVKDSPKAFQQLIDSEPELFRSTIFMPALGNHDKEIYWTGKSTDPLPAKPAYDIAATAFLDFFARPADGWKWTLFLPDFGARFVGLDICHTSDFGTIRQACHDFHRGSEQFEWYRQLMTTNTAAFTITLHNERNEWVRGLDEKAWQPWLESGTAAISGYGYFAERALANGFPYFNTALSAGDKYPDAGSKFLQATGNYMLMTFRPGQPLDVQFKSLDGKILDQSQWLPRKRGAVLQSAKQ